MSRFVCIAARYALARDRAIRTPSAEQLIALRNRVRARHSKAGAERRWRVSNEFASELRRRGWLHAEGYASPTSWSAP